MAYIHYARMRVGDLTPREYWETGAEDYLLAQAVQHELHAGVEEAREDVRKHQEWAAKDADALARLKARVGA